MTKYEVGKHFTKGKHWIGLAFVVNTEKAEDENYFLNLQETVDLLNNLHKENKQLRQKIKHCVYVDVDNANENELLKKKIRMLEKENEQLKKDLNKLYGLLMDKGMSHNELQDVLWGG